MKGRVRSVYEFSFNPSCISKGRVCFIGKPFWGPIVMYEYQTQWFEMHRDGEIMWI
jgi:hypothetical protein